MKVSNITIVRHDSCLLPPSLHWYFLGARKASGMWMMVLWSSQRFSDQWRVCIGGPVKEKLRLLLKIDAVCWSCSWLNTDWKRQPFTGLYNWDMIVCNWPFFQRSPQVRQSPAKVIVFYVVRNACRCTKEPHAGSGVVRIDLLCYMARCCKSRLNQALSCLPVTVVFFNVLFIRATFCV